MPYNKFEPDTLLEIDGADYKPIGYVNGRHQWVHTVTGELFRCPDADGNLVLPDDADYSRLLLEERLKIKSSPSKDRTRFLNDVAQWTLDQAKVLDPTVEKKLEQVRLLDDAGIANGEKAINRHLAEHWTGELVEKYGPHDPARTIRRWRTKRGRAGFRKPGQMVSMRGRAARHSRSGDVPSEVEWKHALQHQADRCKVADTYSAFLEEMKAINEGRHPTYPKPDKPYRIIKERTMRRRIEALENGDTTKAKKGEQAVEQDWSGGGRPLVADFAMQYVIIDHTRLDVHAVDDEAEMVLGRAWLTVAIDVRTRAVTAHLITFIDPCTWTVGEILRRMVLPKRPPTMFAEQYPILIDLRGKPFELIVDNASEFRSHTLEAAARGAGFNVRFCPVKRPRYRAICERTIGTLKRLICDNLPGRVLPPEEARRLGHDSEADACMIMREIEAVANFVVAQYNTSPHDDLNDRQPALLFQQDAAKNGINNFSDFELFRLDTMKIVPDAQITPSGVKAFSCLRYYGQREVRELLDDLVPLEGRRKRRDDATATTEYRYDPADIRYIYVWNRKTRKHVRLTCSDERYADGMPEWFHDQIRTEAKKQALAFNTEDDRLTARAQLISAIKAISPTDTARARKTVADLYEIPRIRQITGNIVWLHSAPPQTVTLDQFLANDRAAETALDNEILSPRNPPARRREPNQNLKDRRDAGSARPTTGPAAQTAATEPTTAPRRRRLNTGN